MAWWRVWKTKKQQPEKKKRNLDHLSERARVIVKASRDPEVKINELLEDLKVERRGHDFDFPKDPEKWTEMDMQEFWGYRPLVTESHLTGWNPMTATPQDWIEALREKSVGRPFYVAPYYIPFRREYPVVPENEHDIATPKDVIEELDRMEEFLTWVSFIFPDGSSYEGTIWDDHANGKGVYISPEAQFRYEGEWFQNLMDGHGVLEFDIPEIQPVPGSDLEDAMRARGKIIKRDYMSPEDQKWLEMDIEDSLKYTTQEVPYYERNIWKNIFGKLPEKGRYKYAGQWKHGRMHGCGVYEVNERIRYGRFYFGIHLNNSTGCHADVSMAHAGLAEVAAAKARMFVNKPDGMIREYKGPYSDPQHPYLYEDEDVWMAPGFINQFYEVPDYWKTYVEEVDQEREMWLNSFYKAPLRIPMPAELEYWWENDASPEFIVINKEPIPDPEDPSKLIYDEDPLIYHTRSKKIINYVDDEEHGIRLFWQPPVSPDDVENFDMKNVRFLPPGFDEFYGKTKTAPIKKGLFGHLRTSVDNSLKPMIQKIETWIKNNKEASERNLNRIQEELKLVNSRLDVEEEMEDLVLKIEYKQKEEEEKLREEEWKLTLQAMKQREEERKQKMQERRIQKEEESKLKEQTSKQKKTEKDLKEEKAVPKQDMEVSLSTGNDETENDKEDADEEQASSSFGAAFKDLKDEKTEDIKPGKDSKSSPFSSLSLSLCTQLVPTLVTTKQKYLFSVLKEVKQSWTSQHSPAPSHRNNSSGQNGDNLGHIGFNIYAWNSARPIRLRAMQREPWKPSKKHHRTNQTQLDCLAQILSGPKAFN